MPQPPQLFLSAVVFTHSVPQSVCPPAHTMPDPPEPVVPAVPVMPLGTEPAQPASVRSNAAPAPVIGIRAAFIHGRIPDQKEGDLLCDLSFISVCGHDEQVPPATLARLLRARDRLHDAPAEAPTVAALAAEVRLSRAHFFRSFVRAFGVTPHDSGRRRMGQKTS